MGDDDLKKRIETARDTQDRRQRRGKYAQKTSPLGAALQHSMGLVAAVMVGGFIGYTIDNFAGTGPWGLLIFLFLGIAAGFLNIIRAAQAMTAEALRDQDSDIDEGKG